jgi:hypothetical protein
VAESLRRGKICLASDIPSVREIVMDRRDLLDPLDPRAWSARIAMYAISKIAREHREAEIRSSYKVRLWQNTVAQIAYRMEEVVPDRVSTLYGGEVVAGNRIASLFARTLPANEAEIVMRFRPIVRAGRDLELFLCSRGSEEASISWQLAVNRQPILDWMSEGTQTSVIAARVPRALVQGADIVEVHITPLFAASTKRSSNSNTKLLEITKLALIEVVDTSGLKSNRHLSRRADVVAALNASDQQWENSPQDQKSSEDQSKVKKQPSLPNTNISHAPGGAAKRRRKKRRTLKRAIKGIIKVMRWER